ncbi:hypothetical protein BI347_22050 [Chromobacterium sphagni]|uniref:KfrA N-terminal DNA-binding domain-containing protein n=1 Tax=Chromobacterium sphagni TaxID=1903179 RepID=A0A1S1WUA4_9NEIS|nr:DNA-binding protein [Chromobacterium sphagni]OHX10462.1 hypothetical protein BI347_22050 [Chromobacterium sphagni]
MAADIYARIRQTAFELVGEGVWPTVVDVRSRLGSGSNTTINNTLKEWRQEFLGRVAASSRRPDWPPSLAEAFEQVWQKACDEAEQQLSAVRQEVEAEVAVLRQQVEGLHEREQKSLAELQSLRHELELRAARQVELDSSLQRERLHVESLLRERQELQQAAELQREAQDLARQEAESRLLELADRHEQQLREAQEEASRKESLAYERLEGLRVRLYQQVESERQEMKLQQQKLEGALQQARQDGAKVENLWRERMLERERENGGLQARLDLLQQQGEAVRQESRLQKESAEAQLLALTAENARLQALQSMRREQWLDRLGAALRAGGLPAGPEAVQSWLAALLTETAQ